MFDITAQKRWGIIGDGQLARMLALAAPPLGVRPVVLTGDSSSSAGQVAPLIVRGHIESRDDLHGLLSQVDGAVIESEFVNCDLIEATGMGDKVFPSLESIRVLQNKARQKRLLNSLCIKTSPLHEKGRLPDEEWIETLTEGGSRPMVLKFASFGYDGKGVLVLNGEGANDLAKALDFLSLAKKRGIEVFAEDKVKFCKELAMIAARGQDGEMIHWPLVISEQTNGVCDRVIGPATSHGVDPLVEIKAKIACETIAGNLGLVGVFAVEFFLTSDGELLVNEIAPRVHNSGHYTQNAGCTSQFENHWRAVLNLPLGPTKTLPFFMMQNVLGPAEIVSKECAQAPQGARYAYVHWYGKRGFSPGRKLGHINGNCHDLKEKGDVMSGIQSTYGRWIEEVKSHAQTSAHLENPTVQKT